DDSSAVSSPWRASRDEGVGSPSSSPPPCSQPGALRTETVVATDRSPTPGLPRLLLVEDDPTTSRALGVLLSRAGWEVVCVSTVAEALAALARAAPAWVILDLMLP